MRNKFPTELFVDDLRGTRREADIEAKVDKFVGNISSARQFVETRLLLLLNRAVMLDTQEKSRGDGPKNYETSSREITKEIRQLDRIAPFLGIEDNQ